MLFEMQALDQLEDEVGAIRGSRTLGGGSGQQRICYADVCDEFLPAPGA
jgi:hypothetical protein